MKYFIDTEFREEPGTIDLISIGIVAEDGREYYAINNEFDLKKAFKDDWIRDNVLLKFYEQFVHGDMKNSISFSLSTLKNILKTQGKSKKRIKEDLELFIQDKPSFYGYFADYDWVVFCWIFGRMMNLPDRFPMYCGDLKQLMDERGLATEWKEKNCPQGLNEHDALGDAKWNVKLYKAIMSEDCKTKESIS